MAKDTIILPANTAKTKETRVFMDEIRGWFGNLDIGLTNAHRKTVQIFFDTVVEYTPKKTGYASYNWRVSNSGGDNNLDNSLEPRKEVIGHYVGRTVGDPVDLSSIRWNSNSTVYNFVPYIEMLNKGYSTQHPHFFEHAVKKADAVLRTELGVK